MNRHVLFRCVLALLGFAPNLFAQGVGASGDIKGIIKDSSGAVMLHVAVAIVETDKGIRYTVATDSSGQYRMTGLAPASYEVSAAIPGFESQVRKNVVLNLRETVIVDFQMKVSGGKEIVEVLAGSPVVDNVEQIFPAFFTTKPQGSGMGWAITRSIEESQGGRLWATANDGRGTTFHFT